MPLLQNKSTKLTKILVLIFLNLNLWSQITLTLDLEKNPVYTWCTLPANYNNAEFLHSRETCIARQCAASFNLEAGFSIPPTIGTPANWDAYGYKDINDCINREFLPSFYEILDLPNNRPTQEQIKKNYRKAAMKLHPDKTIHMSEINRAIAAAMFKRVNAANTILQDPRDYNLYQAEIARQGLARWEPDFLKRFITARDTSAKAAGGVTEAKGAAAEVGGGGGGGANKPPKPAGDIALLYPELITIYSDINRQLEIFNQTALRLLNNTEPDITMALFRENLEEIKTSLYLLSLDTKNLLAQNNLNFQWSSADLTKFRLINEAADQISEDILDLYGISYQLIAGDVFTDAQGLRAQDAQILKAQLETTIAKYEADPHVGDLASKLDNLRATVQLLRQKYIRELTLNLTDAEKLSRNIYLACQDYLTILKPAAAATVPVGTFAELAQNLVRIIDLLQRKLIVRLDTELDQLLGRIDRILVTDPRAHRINMLQREIAGAIASANWAMAESRLLELENLLDQALNSGRLTQAQINEIGNLLEYIERTRPRIRHAGGGGARAIGGGGAAAVPAPVSAPAPAVAPARSSGDVGGARATGSSLTFVQANILKNLPKNRVNLEKIIAVVSTASPRDMAGIKVLAKQFGLDAATATKETLLAKLQAELELL